METETHKIKKKNKQIQFYKRINNPNEIVYFFISLFKISAFSTFLLLACIFSYQSRFESIIHFLLIIIIGALLAWMLNIEILQIIIRLKRNFRPILTIDKFTFVTLNKYGNYEEEKEIQKIRSIEGRGYSDVAEMEGPIRIYFTEIFIGMTNGEYLFFDGINSSKLYRPIPDVVTNELKDKTKKIGKLIAKELDTQFFLKKGYNKLD